MHYWLHPKLSWQTFKKLNDKFGRDSGPVPVNGDKVIYKMLTKDRTVNIYISTDANDRDDPIIITTKQIPNNALMIMDKK